MDDGLDLEPIKARLAATTPGEWQWIDAITGMTFTDETYTKIGSKQGMTSNNDTLEVVGLFIEEVANADMIVMHPVMAVRENDEIPEDPEWYGPIQVTNLADMVFIEHAKADIAALITEVERLRTLLRTLESSTPSTGA